MNWLVMSFALQTGFISAGVTLVPYDAAPIYWATPSRAIETTIEARAMAFDHIRLSTFVRSYQVPSENRPYFNPFRVDYGAEAAIIWGPLMAGVRHECDHEVVSIHDTSDGFEGFSTEVFIRFEAKVTF